MCVRVYVCERHHSPFPYSILHMKLRHLVSAGPLKHSLAVALHRVAGMSHLCHLVLECARFWSLWNEVTLL